MLYSGPVAGLEEVEEPEEAEEPELELEEPELEVDVVDAAGLESFDRLVVVDQRPIGRTPRSNLATCTGMFDAVRKLYAATDLSRQRGYSPGRFSFNVAEGRCETCQGEGFVAVELLFLPGPTHRARPATVRYNAETLEITYQGKNVAEVLDMPVADAAKFLADVPAASRSLETLRDVGLDYLRLGQPATELSGGEAQPIKLATESQRARRGHALYLLDEPTAGLHPADIALLLGSCTGSSTRATPSSWSSTTWTRSPPRTGSSTSAPVAGTPAGGWWRAARRRKSRRRRRAPPRPICAEAGTTLNRLPPHTTFSPHPAGRRVTLMDCTPQDSGIGSDPQVRFDDGLSWPPHRANRLLAGGFGLDARATRDQETSSRGRSSSA